MIHANPNAMRHCCHSVQAARAALPQRRALSSPRRSARWPRVLFVPHHPNNRVELVVVRTGQSASCTDSMATRELPLVVRTTRLSGRRSFCLPDVPHSSLVPWYTGGTVNTANRTMIAGVRLFAPLLVRGSSDPVVRAECPVLSSAFLLRDDFARRRAETAGKVLYQRGPNSIVPGAGWCCLPIQNGCGNANTQGP